MGIIVLKRICTAFFPLFIFFAAQFYSGYINSYCWELGVVSETSYTGNKWLAGLV